MVCEERGDSPGGGEDGDDEEDEDVVGREGVLFAVNVDKVGEHAQSWDQCNDLKDAPKGEEDTKDHVEGGGLFTCATCEELAT